MPPFIRRYDDLQGQIRPLCIEVFKSYDQVRNAFHAAFPGAYPAHEDHLMREWAALASVPANTLINFKFCGNMPDEDARRVLQMAEPILLRIQEVKAGSLPVPKWAEGIRVLGKGIGQLEDSGRPIGWGNCCRWHYRANRNGEQPGSRDAPRE